MGSGSAPRVGTGDLVMIHHCAMSQTLLGVLSGHGDLQEMGAVNWFSR